VGFLTADAGAGFFFVYGGDGDRWTVCGDLKGLNKVGDDRGFEYNQRGFVIIDSQLNGFQSGDRKVIKCLLICGVKGEEISDEGAGDETCDAAGDDALEVEGEARDIGE
jgi:hypothetical protein